MKKLLSLTTVILFIAASTQAQTLKVSPFHRLPTQMAKASLFGSAVPTKAAAWRFTAAAASYDIINNKVLTGIGYGYNRMHLKTDSTGNSTWYTDFTANFSIYASGSAVPTYSYGNTNVVAIGPSIGILNKLINIGYVYYPAVNGSKSQSGVIAGISIPLN